MPSIEVLDLGINPYQHILKLQEKLFHANLESKEHNRPTQNTIILCEHHPVYTLGKSGKRENILVSDEELAAEYYHVNRGGDVTFHGPGQLVVYPILDLETLGIGLAQYIFKLEQVVIETLLQYKINCVRIENAAGLWIIDEMNNERKICAIGVKSSRHITMHGIAINLNTDLSWFSKIIPCGLQGKGVTSLEKETGNKVDMNAFKKVFENTFKREFDFR
ncbi:MAG: lipoyl(octanoyl) transferase LipB [Bacteroidetes bacterium]|nr:lipoyl(octanoyl) transferase LipB [Bacteroidota bacterium]